MEISRRVPYSINVQTTRDDGRKLRSERTRRVLIDAYLRLLTTLPDPPTAVAVAHLAGYSTRSIFERFVDMPSLAAAAADVAFGVELDRLRSTAMADDRLVRLRAHMGALGRMAERLLPLWRVLNAHRREIEVRARILRLQLAIRLHLMEVYSVELDGLPVADRDSAFLAVENLVDLEAWARLRARNLTVDQAADVLVYAVDRLLPAQPQDAAFPRAAATSDALCGEPAQRANFGAC